jgi:leader peptidase (prepilin peptidase)/N-methyltransferase
MTEYMVFVWIGFTFLLGAAIGSWLNVCIYRIPYEKSVLWPGSHCGHCFQPVRWYDNIPLVSYWMLRGRCRRCGTRFSARYFLVELLTGAAFAGLFYLDVIVNVQRIPRLEQMQPFIALGWIPLEAWLFWLGHAVLVSFLIVTSVTDLDHMEIPLSITITGTLFGLVLAACLPWPWPNTPAELRAVRGVRPGFPGLGLFRDPVPVLGFQPWPLWRPDELPNWLQPGTWRLGLATGLAGVLAGMLMLRAVRFLFGLGRGIEGMGVGDADLMMMAGAFLGWQPILVAFFVSVFPALLWGLGKILVTGNQEMPFGPPLALGVLMTLFGWRWLGPYFQPLFFDAAMLIALGVTGAVLLVVIAFVLRLIRGTPPDEPEAAEADKSI